MSNIKVSHILGRMPQSSESSSKVYLPYTAEDEHYEFVKNYTSSKNTNLLKEKIGLFFTALQKDPERLAQALEQILNS